MKSEKRDILFIFSLLVFAFVFYFVWSLMTPFGGAPDEQMRYDIVKFIYQTGTIPRGDDPSIINPIWGFSYAFMPILPYMFGSLFQKIVSFFSVSPFVLLMAARMVSIVSSLGTIYMCFLIGKELFPKSNFRYVFPVFIALFPQFAFISTYVNVDAFAIMSITGIFYFWIRGAKSGWITRDSVGLAIFIGLCALSYYNCYGYILLSVPYFFYTIIRYGRDRNYIIKQTSLVILVVFVIAGWWFIRNGILYDGDLLGRRAAAKCAEIHAIDAYKPSNRLSLKSSGVPLAKLLFGKLYGIRWSTVSYTSFIGNFSTMTLPISKRMVISFSFVFLAGFIGIIIDTFGLVKQYWLTKKKDILDSLFNYGVYFLAILIPIIISIIYSYTSDFQPQGRYILPLIIPFAFFVCRGLEKINEIFNKIIKKQGLDLSVFVFIFMVTSTLVILLDILYNFYVV